MPDPIELMLSDLTDRYVEAPTSDAYTRLYVDELSSVQCSPRFTSGSTSISGRSTTGPRAPFTTGPSPAAEYVPDFVIGERSSSGFEWQFVELQSPHARLFVKSSGRQSKQFDEGLRQINDWRRWLDNNRDYARRPRARHGLGLDNASGSDPGLLIIGREADLSEADIERRRQLDQQKNIRIHTYDWLVRQAKARLAALER
jgi:hypothetical protein